MYALALLTSAGLAAAGLPYFHIGALDIGVPIQGFGMIIAVAEEQAALDALCAEVLAYRYE